MKKPFVTLNLYIPNQAKKREIRRKAQYMGKSVSVAVIEYFDSLVGPLK